MKYCHPHLPFGQHISVFTLVRIIKKIKKITIKFISSHFDNISIPIITWCLNTTMPQNKRDKPGSSFSVDMSCQTYSCLTRQGYGKSLFRFPDTVKKKEFYMTWLTNLNIEETSFMSTKHKLVRWPNFNIDFIPLSNIIKR
jgi:hypothetical protein